MFPLNTIIAWSINIIMNKKYDNNNIIIASRAYFLHFPAPCRRGESPPEVFFIAMLASGAMSE
jgi:hypothetical protein